MHTIGEWIRLSMKKNFIHPANGFFVMLDDVLDCLGVWVFWASLQEMGAGLQLWEGDSLFIFMGMSVISSGISCLFVGGYDLEEHRLRGTLDFYLIKPLHGMLLILAERVNFLRVFLLFGIGTGMLMGGFGAIQRWILLIPAILMCVFATCMIHLGELCLRCLCFWFGRVNRAVDICSGVRQFSNYPLTFFPKIIQTVLLYVVPVGMCTTIPAQLLTGTAGISFCLLLLAQCLLVVVLYCFIWEKGVAHYDSAN